MYKANLHIYRLGEWPSLHPGLVLHVGHLHAETVAVHEAGLLPGCIGSVEKLFLTLLPPA